MCGQFIATPLSTVFDQTGVLEKAAMKVTAEQLDLACRRMLFMDVPVDTWK